MLLESMFQGIEALSFSTNTAAEGQTVSEGAEPEELSTWAMAGSIAMAIVMGMGLFVALPHFLTAVLTAIAWAAKHEKSDVAAPSARIDTQPLDYHPLSSFYLMSRSSSSSLGHLHRALRVAMRRLWIDDVLVVARHRSIGGRWIE